jgi:hypothetical protein
VDKSENVGRKAASRESKEKPARARMISTDPILLSLAVVVGTIAVAYWSAR